MFCEALDPKIQGVGLNLEKKKKKKGEFSSKESAKKEYERI